MQTWFSLYEHCMSIKVNCKPHVKKYYPVITGFDCGQPGLLAMLAAAGQTLATVTAGRKDVDQISMGIFTALSLWKQAEHVGVREKEEGMRTRWILEEAGMLTLEGLVPN